ncbi:MAG: hypothetical protein JW927_09905 [Deltaproteobacteria bacterium]|nr:hypothetical protein [Deltaproteobacteria bacterium]
MVRNNIIRKYINIEIKAKTVNGWITKNIETKLGEGGAQVSLNTVNGGVRIEKKQ